MRRPDGSGQRSIRHKTILYAESQKTVACSVFYNLKKLESIFVTFGTLVVHPDSPSCESMRHFPRRFIYTCSTLQFTSILQNDAFARQCQVSKRAI